MLSTCDDLLRMVAPFTEKEGTVVKNATLTSQSLSDTLLFFVTGQIFEGMKLATAEAHRALG
jgi:hypothetical protein